MLNYYQKLPKPFFILAPMDDVTDTVFRQIVNGCAPADLYFTEFVNVDGLQSDGRQKLLKKMRFVEHEGPLVAQIWGKDPEHYFKTAQQIADGTFARELGLPGGRNYVGVDINMGCPEKSAVKHGTCSALINDRPLARQIISAIQAGLAGRLPLSVKTRLGFSSVDLTWLEFLLQHELSMLSIHGRTRKQMSKVPADWNLIGQARQLRDSMKLNTLIIGNGDVLSRQQGLALATEHRLDGIMIGRGIFSDPYIFSNQNVWPYKTTEERIELYRNHVQLFDKTWQNKERAVKTLNRFCKVYINGFDGAKDMREQLMAAHSTTELLTILADSASYTSSKSSSASS